MIAIKQMNKEALIIGSLPVNFVIAWLFKCMSQALRASHTLVNNHLRSPARWDVSLLWWPPANHSFRVWSHSSLYFLHRNLSLPTYLPTCLPARPPAYLPSYLQFATLDISSCHNEPDTVVPNHHIPSFPIKSIFMTFPNSSPWVPEPVGVRRCRWPGNILENI